jgi:hypothetical protein
MTASATIRNPQSFNRYSYALNSPYKFTDPLGLFPIGGNHCRRCFRINGQDWWDGGGGSNPFASEPSEERSAGAVGTSAGSTVSQAVNDPSQSPPDPTPVNNGGTGGSLRDAPQHLLAEAINRIQRVVLIKGGDARRAVPGVAAFDENTTTEITNVLGSGYTAGVDVGAIAATTDGVTVLSSITSDESRSGGVTISMSPAVTGTTSDGISRTRDVSSADALKKDQAARAANASAVDRVATRLDGITLNVSTARGSRQAVAGRAFWKQVLTREVDLIYRRGVVVGHASASRIPALAPTR